MWVKRQKHDDLKPVPLAMQLVGNKQFSEILNVGQHAEKGEKNQNLFARHILI